MSKYDHLYLSDTSNSLKYSRPRLKIDSTFKTPDRDRRNHGQNLLNQIDSLSADIESDNVIRKRMEIKGQEGITVTFESEPGFELKFDSLEFAPSKIELLSLKQIDRKWMATVFIPEGKISHFIKRITKYTEEETKSGKAKHKDLIESISKIKKATLESLWTDENDLLPEPGEIIWWEIWLRGGNLNDNIYNFFIEDAITIGLKISPGKIEFLDRDVLLVKGSIEQISDSINLLNSIAEIRSPKVTAEFFTRMDKQEQYEWLDDLKNRIVPAEKKDIAISILDTGVNNKHPIIEDHLLDEDMHTYMPQWLTNDQAGHGTEMAGLAIYGDLTPLLSGTDSLNIPYILESVKIIPSSGSHHDPTLYGSVIQESVSRIESNFPNRKRAISLAIASQDTRDRGRPSSWSSSIDSITFGDVEENKKLFIVSSGNGSIDNFTQYPYNVETEEIHDPAQSWNALTVGAFTEKTIITEYWCNDWKPLAKSGALSPSSSSSLTWNKQWPYKPDVVFEGGNVGLSPNGDDTDFLDSLQILTTNNNFLSKYFKTTGDTSAATYLASKFAATLWKRYENYWPETIRGLIVHSAKWTDEMLNYVNHSNLTGKKRINYLLRTCGYGFPDINKAINSSENTATMIIEDYLYPYEEGSGSNVKTSDMNIHTLPWPADFLLDLGELEVTLRITLSYYIEPSPGERGNKNKYQYASHGLRFEVKTPSETKEDFNKRINQIARDEDANQQASYQSGSEEWEIGPMYRKCGSIHSDWWSGTAADLSERGYVAVFPVTGWWKHRKNLERWRNKVRYSLIITISTNEEEVDIYTSIKNMIDITVDIDT